MQSSSTSSGRDRSRSALAIFAGAFVGVLPFVFLAANAVLTVLIPRRNLVGGFLFPAETLDEYIGIAPWLVWSLPIIVGFAVGWARGFPRWSFSFVGMMVLVVPGALGAPGSSEYAAYGLVAWLPAATLGAAFVVLAITSWRKLGRLATGVGGDWTRLSFAMLAVVTPLYFALIHDSPDILTGVILALVAVGSIAYLLTSTVRAGALALLASVVLIATIPEVWLWAVQRDNPYSGGVDSLALSILIPLGVFVVLVFWPGMIGLVRRGSRSKSRGGGASEGIGG